MSMRSFVFFIIALCAMVASVSAQGNGHYYFMGYIHSKSSTNTNVYHPYVTVLLSLESELEEIIAATMSDPRGEFNFDGVEIDLKKDYLFTVLLPTGNVRKYRRPGGEVTFSPNTVNVHICLETNDINTNYYTKRNINFDKKTGFFSKKINLFDQVAQNSGLVRNGSNFIRAKDDASIYVFIQRFLPPSILQTMMDKIVPELVTSVTLVELMQPNEFFGGALYFDLVPEMQERMGLKMLDINITLEKVI